MEHLKFQLLNSVVALGRLENGLPVLEGSGFFIYSGTEVRHLVTATHVIDQAPSGLVAIGEGGVAPIPVLACAVDADLDLTIYTVRDPNRYQPVDVRYSPDGVVLGDLGVALGFPVSDLSAYVYMKGWPMPVPTPCSAYFPNVGASDFGYVGGFVSTGYSGGPVAFPVNGVWAISGMVIQRCGLPRATDEVSGHCHMYGEPTGLTKIVPIYRITQLIDRMRAN